MQEGEAAYTRRDYDKAIEAYQRASRLKPLDPKSGYVADLKARTFQPASSPACTLAISMRSA